MRTLDRAASTEHPGPWGPILLAATDRGLCGLSLLSHPDAFRDELARRSTVAIEPVTPGAEAARTLDAACRQLDEYFAGRRRSFDLPIDLRVRTAWDREVLAGVRTIAFGEVLGYGQLAARIGRRGAARATGGALGRNPIGLLVPCHRVIAGDGGLGGYGSDWFGTREDRLAIKRELLAMEGVALRDDPLGLAEPGVPSRASDGRCRVSVLRAYRSLLGNRNLSRLLAGEFISGIGDWLYLVALLIVVYQYSQNALLLGVVGAARVLPYVLLSVPAGMAADRFDRRLILIVTDTARGLIMLGLAYLVQINGPIGAIVGLAIFATCFSTFFGPTIGAYLPGLVRDERELGPANSAWAFLNNLAFVVGPLLAGVLVAIGGLTVAFLLNAVSFLIVDLILWRLPSSTGRVAPTAVAASGEAAPDTIEGAAAETIATTAATPPPPATEPPAATAPAIERDVRLTVLLGLSIMDIVGSFVFGGVSVLTVFLATNTYGTGDAGTGWLNAAIGVGGLIGAILSGALVLRPSMGPVLIAGALAAGIGLVTLGVVNTITLAIVALTVASAGSLILEVVSTTIFQRAIPDRIRGRALGVMATASALAFALGSFLVPVLADQLGVTPVLVIAGVAVTIGSVIGRILVGGVATRPVSPYEATLARATALPIFAGMSAARLEGALRHLQPRPFAAGDVVIREGEPADRFYLIDTGRVRVTQLGPDGVDRRLRDMGPDEVFGEIGLLRESPRTATVTGLEPGLLLALERDAFLELVSTDARLGSRLLDLNRGTTGTELRTESVAVSPS